MVNQWTQEQIQHLWMITHHNINDVILNRILSDKVNQRSKILFPNINKIVMLSFLVIPIMKYILPFS